MVSEHKIVMAMKQRITLNKKELSFADFNNLYSK